VFQWTTKKEKVKIIDPLTGAIVAAVLFWLLKDLGAVVIVFAVTGLFAIIGWLISGLSDDGAEVGASIGAVIGWFLAVVWLVFALVQTILQIVVAVQTLAG